jgi:large subunit ribosomal protein L32e
MNKKRKLRFLRNLWWKFPKFENNLKWQKPKGKDNPMRLRKKGYPPVVTVGYRTPRIIRGLHPAGLRPVIIHNPRELDELNPAEVVVYIGSDVGMRKREAILNKARELGFLVANAR